MAAGRISDRPFTLLVQYDPWDPSPGAGRQVDRLGLLPRAQRLDVDMTAAIEAQVERFAPGFRDRILARPVHGPGAMEAHDRNYVGGDINAGLSDIRQLLFRPRPSAWTRITRVRASTWAPSSTPPGGGVHGMSGHLAARSALRRELR